LVVTDCNFCRFPSLWIIARIVLPGNPLVPGGLDRHPAISYPPEESQVLNFFPQRMTNCETVSRRNFMLQVGSLGALGLTLDSFLRQQAAVASTGRKDVNCILI